MTARRLALVQPEAFEPSPETLAKLTVLKAKHPEGRERSAMIPALWVVQKQCGGWLPEPALRWLGDQLDTPYVRVYEVATFYTMFNLEPVGEHHVQLCGTTPCWLRGADDLKAVCERVIGPKGTRSADGKLSWVEVECLGACVNAPMVQISNAAGDEYYEDLTADTMEALLADLAAGRTVEAGPQSDRRASEPFGGPATLIDADAYRKVKPKKLPNSKKTASVTAHADDPKGTRATSAGRKTKPKEPAPTKAPKAAHERSVDADTPTKDGGKMKAPATKAEDITDRKPVLDADGNPTPDPKGAAVAPKRRGEGRAVEAPGESLDPAQGEGSEVEG